MLGGFRQRSTVGFVSSHNLVNDERHDARHKENRRAKDRAVDHQPTDLPHHERPAVMIPAAGSRYERQPAKERHNDEGPGVKNHFAMIVSLQLSPQQPSLGSGMTGGRMERGPVLFIESVPPDLASVQRAQG